MDFSVLEGLDLVKLGRAADMLWMSIGEPLVITSRRNGQKRIVNRFAFHIQCPWRLLQNRSILLGSSDIYEPKNIALASDPDWNWDVFTGEQSIFNETAHKLNDSLLPLTVIDITVFNNGDLRITFNKDIVFELFIPGSKEREYWRFIDFEKEFHHVVFQE